MIAERKHIIIWFLLLFIAMYQDFPLINTFGEIARTPVIFFLPLFLLYIFMHRHIVVSKALSYWIYYFLYSLFISIVYIGVVYYHNESWEVFYENIVVKTLKMSIYPLSGIIFYQFIYAYLKQLKSPYKTVFYSLLLMQIFIFCWLIFEIYFLKKDTIFLPQIHSTPEKYWRIRLWTMEESWTGTILILLTFFPLYFIYKVRLKKGIKYLSIFLSIAIFFSYVAVSESKGFLLLVMVCVLPMFFQLIRKHLILRKISFYIFIVLVGIFIIAILNLQTVIFNTFYNNITFGTRLTSIQASLQVFMQSIVGVGYSGFVYFYPKAIENAMNYGFFSQLDLREIKAYLSTTKALSSKTAFFDELMFGGVVYLVFFYHFFIKRIKYFFKQANQENYFLLIPLLFITLAGIIYITYHIKYEIWIFLAFIDFVLISPKNSVTNDQ